jgi:hypothetical protein
MFQTTNQELTSIFLGIAIPYGPMDPGTSTKSYPIPSHIHRDKFADEIQSLIKSQFLLAKSPFFLDHPPVN